MHSQHASKDVCGPGVCFREELYPMPYDKIDWNAARNQIAKEDLYYPHPMIQVGDGCPPSNHTYHSRMITQIKCGV